MIKVVFGACFIFLTLHLKTPGCFIVLQSDGDGFSGPGMVVKVLFCGHVTYDLFYSSEKKCFVLNWCHFFLSESLVCTVRSECSDHCGVPHGSCPQISADLHHQSILHGRFTPPAAPGSIHPSILIRDVMSVPAVS